jgi:nucleotide-binding universal stress UspA family protein
MQTALDEASRREAPVLALISWPARSFGSHHTEDDLRVELDRHLQDAGRKDSDVQVCAASTPANLTHLLAQTTDIDQLVIVGKNNPELISELVGPQARAQLRRTNCSVMIFRGDQEAVLAAS